MRGYPNRYIVFDTESHSQTTSLNPPRKVLTLRLGVAYVVDSQANRGCPPRVVQFRDSGEFHDAVLGMPFSSMPIYVFAHNMGFDVRMVEWFRYVTSGHYSLMPPSGMKGAGRYKTPLFVGESPPFIVRLWRSDGQQIMLLDTFQWVLKSLKDVGEWIESPKGSMPDASAPDEDWFIYCQQDVELTYRMLKRLWRWLWSLHVPDFMPTPASQSYHLYRMRWEKKRIVRPKDPESLWLDRHGYYAGRVECFYLGRYDRWVHQVDVTSLYPAVMEGSEFPAQQIETHLDRAWSDPPEDFEPGRCTAEVYLESDTNDYPIRAADGTYYCTGRVRTILCGPELEQAWVRGDIRFVGRYVKYKLLPLFTGFVRYLWACRKSAQNRGDHFEDYLCKSIMNSLHGKFGQRTGDWIYQGKQLADDKYLSGGSVGKGIEYDREFRVLAGHAYERDPGQEDPRGFVPIAAWCTSYARVFMDEIRAKCGPHNVIYQSTDSLLVNGEGLGQLQVDNLVRDREMGYFRHEGSYEWASVNGVHDLDLADKRKRPGIRKTASHLYGETYEQEAWAGFSSAVFAGKVSSVSIETVSKTIRHGYAKRTVGLDGFTAPFAVDNWRTPPEEQRKLSLDRQ